MSRKITTYLVVRADGNVRIRTSKPSRGQLGLDEVAVPIVIHIPDGWGAIVNDQIDVHLPQPPSFEPVNPDAIVVGEAEAEPEPDGD